MGRRLHQNLTVQVLFAIALAVVLGLVAPGTAQAMRPLGDVFINLI
jgi:aerobic C4-dicarboxylate transport protein